jgi:hypothetical protein
MVADIGEVVKHDGRVRRTLSALLSSDAVFCGLERRLAA